MDHISSVSYNQKDTTVQLKEAKKTTEQLSTVEIDRLFSDLGNLVNQQFKPWYCRVFYRIGRSKALELAAVAKSDGFNPPRLFSKLLKEANND
jgi:hypothetical protein